MPAATTAAPATQLTTEVRSGEPAEAGDVPRDVPGPAGLPSSDPDSLRADPSEGDQDPSAGMGRG